MDRPIRTALVTGASTGIGEAIALDLASEGWRVVASGRREDKLAEVLSKLQAISDLEHASVVLDLSAIDTLESDLARLNESYALDALVNNAGISFIHPFLEVTLEKYQALMDVNLRGVFFATQYFARLVIRDGRAAEAAVVNVASMASKEGGVKLLSDYIGSKFGVLGLTQAIAKELGQYGIRVNAVCPGYIRTEMQVREEVWEGEITGQSVEEIRAFFVERAALERIGVAEDIAPTVSFLLSGKASFITGESIAINGGVYMD